MHIFSTSNLNGVLRAVSSGLRYPVIIVLILIMAATLMLLGSLLVEIFTERRQLKVSMPRLVDQLRTTGRNGEKAMTEAITSSGLLRRQKTVLTELIRHPDLTAEMRQALADRLVEEEQSRLERIVKLSDLLAKLGPIFGLLGTLIPGAPASSPWARATPIPFPSLCLPPLIPLWPALSARRWPWSFLPCARAGMQTTCPFWKPWRTVYWRWKTTMRHGNKRRRRAIFSGAEDVNPMNYLSNLSDVMLVLAVGMMLALVVAWNVDIVNSVPNPSDMTQAEISQMEELNRQDLNALHTSENPDNSQTSVEDFGLTEYGVVYRDADGNLYVLEADTEK